MAVKPETTFIASVHRFLPKRKDPYREKMNNPYHGGTADVWYSGQKADYWIEYKFLPRVPQRGGMSPERYGLTALQMDWLRGRHSENRKVGVIVGTPKGGVILPGLSWDCEMSVEAFTGRIVSRAAIAEWIKQQTMD